MEQFLTNEEFDLVIKILGIAEKAVPQDKIDDFEKFAKASPISMIVGEEKLKESFDKFRQNRIKENEDIALLKAKFIGLKRNQNSSDTGK